MIYEIIIDEYYKMKKWFSDCNVVTTRIYHYCKAASLNYF